MLHNVENIQNELLHGSTKEPKQIFVRVLKTPQISASIHVLPKNTSRGESSKFFPQQKNREIDKSILPALLS